MTGFVTPPPSTSSRRSDLRQNVVALEEATDAESKARRELRRPLPRQSLGHRANTEQPPEFGSHSHQNRSLRNLKSVDNARQKRAESAQNQLEGTGEHRRLRSAEIKRSRSNRRRFAFFVIVALVLIAVVIGGAAYCVSGERPGGVNRSHSRLSCSGLSADWECTLFMSGNLRPHLFKRGIDHWSDVQFASRLYSASS